MWWAVGIVLEGNRGCGVGIVMLLSKVCTNFKLT